MDISKHQLPLGLRADVTPSFFFINEEGKVIKWIAGSWNKEDFLVILEEAIAIK